MQKDELKKYEDLLLKERQEILEDITELEAVSQSGSLQERTGEISSITTHPADRVSDSIEQEQTYNLATMEGEILYQIDEALMRLRKGKFGKCSKCGKPIDQKRLEAIPYAELCLECKRDSEMEMEVEVGYFREEEPEE
ncbi:TraR/DksA C4-type zinc finger protein [bacterium]|nr:TraR/DksA C4-type zinc finger protein [bacterium]